MYMKNLNLVLIILFIKGFIAIFLGSLLHLSGNENATIIIGTGLFLEFFAILLAIIRKNSNHSKCV